VGATLHRVALRELEDIGERLALLPLEDPECVGPELLERHAEALLVAQPLVPHLCMHPVVGLLAVDLGREARDRLVRRGLQGREPDLVGRLVEHAPRDRPRPVRHEAQLDELRAAVLLRGAVERKRVGILGQQLVDRSRVADLVLRDRGEGDVFL
jgi:hypothetical protein